jgi:hypothetical protein
LGRDRSFRFADMPIRGCGRPDKPEDPSNRRISLIVQYLVKEAGDDQGKAKDNQDAPENKGVPSKEEHH